MTEENWFKAISPDDRSGEILVSFSHQWFKKIDRNNISVVFRRRVPRASAPKRLYIYLGAAASSLVGFANILKLHDIDLNGALKLAEKSGLTERDLRGYFAGRESIGCYRIGDIFLFDRAIPLKELRQESGFNPPQSFLFVSKKASEWLHGMPCAPSDLRATLASPFVEEGVGIQ